MGGEFYFTEITSSLVLETPLAFIKELHLTSVLNSSSLFLKSLIPTQAVSPHYPIFIRRSGKIKLS